MLLKPFCVPICEQGSKFNIVFDCLAENHAGAFEQATNIDQNCRGILAEPIMTCQFAIYSPNEAAISDDGAGWWSNSDGWTIQECATIFNKDERESFSLPIATGQDARWVLVAPLRSQKATCGDSKKPT